jgi:hypothetical protein
MVKTMSKFQSVTLSEGKDVSSNVNPAGDGSVGKVVPLNPSQSAVDRIQYADGESFHDTGRVNKVQGNVPSYGEGAMRTVRTTFDTPVNSPEQITPKCSIEIEGKRMTIATAMQCGWLTKVGGDYVVSGSPSQDAQKANDQKTEANQNVKTVDFSDDTSRANMDALNKAGSPQLTMSFAHTLIGNMIDGKECNGIVDTFSQQTGANPASIVEAFEEMFNVQLDRAGEYVNQRYGIKSDAFIEYISETAPSHIKKMAMIAGFHNDLKTLDQLVSAFKAKKVL